MESSVCRVCLSPPKPMASLMKRSMKLGSWRSLKCFQLSKPHFFFTAKLLPNYLLCNLYYCFKHSPLPGKATPRAQRLGWTHRLDEVGVVEGLCRQMPAELGHWGSWDPVVKHQRSVKRNSFVFQHVLTGSWLLTHKTSLSQELFSPLHSGFLSCKSLSCLVLWARRAKFWRRPPLKKSINQTEKGRMQTCLSCPNLPRAPRQHSALHQASPGCTPSFPATTQKRGVKAQPWKIKH